MIKIIRKSLIIFKYFLLLEISVCGAILLNAQEAGGKLKNWGYVYSNSFEKFPQTYMNRMEREYDVLCITGLLLRGSGQLRFENEFLNKISKAGIGKNPEKPLIVPMIGLSSVKDGITLLTSESSRNKSIENITKFLSSYRFKSVHLDFEGLPQDYAKAYSEYLKSLKEQLSKLEIELSIALFPPLEFPDPNGSFHDPAILKDNVDSVVLMAYDLSNQKTEPGCVTSVQWAEKNLIEILKYFPSEKVWLGIPSYGYEWSNYLKTPRVVSSREANLLKKQNSFNKDDSGCIKISIKDGAKEGTIFYADQELRISLQNIADKLKIKGTALWRIGLED